MTDRDGDRGARMGADSLRMGVGLLEGAVESGRAAINEFEEGLRGRDSTDAPELKVLLESAVRGYGTFFYEMARSARQVANEYRSESGRLVSKSANVSREDGDATEPPTDRSAGHGETDSEPDAAASVTGPVGDLNEVVEGVFDMLRGLVGGSR